MNTQQLWQSQALDAPRITLAFVRHQSNTWRRWTWRRNAFNYIASAVFIPLIVWRAWSLFSKMPLYSLAMMLGLASGVLLIFRWHKRAGSQEQPADLGVLDSLKFHRRQLERQRDVRLDRWRRWPAIPAIVMMLVAMLIEVKPMPWLATGLSLALMTLVFSIAVLVEERIARRIQKEIDALDSL